MADTHRQGPTASMLWAAAGQASEQRTPERMYWRVCSASGNSAAQILNFAVPLEHAYLQLNGRSMKSLHVPQAKPGPGLGAGEPQHPSVSCCLLFPLALLPAGGTAVRRMHSGATCTNHALHLHGTMAGAADRPAHWPGARTTHLLAQAKPSCWYEQSTCPCLHLVMQQAHATCLTSPPWPPQNACSEPHANMRHTWQHVQQLRREVWQRAVANSSSRCGCSPPAPSPDSSSNRGGTGSWARGPSRGACSRWCCSAGAAGAAGVWMTRPRGRLLGRPPLEVV